jgi:hypothetical protein
MENRHLTMKVLSDPYKEVEDSVQKERTRD